MTGTGLVTVRVLPERSLSVNDAGESTHYVAGDVVDLHAGEAKQLVADGFVERVK